MKVQSALLAAFLVIGQAASAQETRPPEPTQSTDAPFRLFSTRNVYTFLKLDTRDGRIWQVQWGDKDYRFTEPLSTRAMTSSGRPGRFTLYPTSNIYTFLLLDQDTGDTWHVQWGKASERFATAIRDSGKE